MPVNNVQHLLETWCVTYIDKRLLICVWVEYVIKYQVSSKKWPFKWCLVGSSGFGKTNFTLQIVQHASQLFDQAPSKIVIVYKEFQNIHNRFNDYIPTNFYNEDEIDFEEIT